MTFRILSSMLVLAAVEPLRLEVEAPEALAATAARIERIDPERFRRLMRLVGLDDPGPPIRVALVPEDDELARRTPAWVAGYARADADLIVLFPGRTPSYPDRSFDELLHHEVAHILIARAAGGRPVPRWFHEGLAMAGERAWGLDDQARMAVEYVLREPVRLDELDTMFHPERGAPRRAYALSGAFVRDVFEHYGPGAPSRILDGVARDRPFPRAFYEATGVPLAEAERSFWERRRAWVRWVPFLTSSGVLWLLITLLVLYAIRRRRARSAAIRRRWEDEGWD